MSGLAWWTSSAAPPAPAFVMTVNTNNTETGSSTSTQFQIPFLNPGTYAATVDWGDGNTSEITAWNDTDKLHTYASSGTYEVRITGTAPRIVFNNNAANDKLKVLAASNETNLSLVRLDFNGCTNLASVTSNMITNETSLVDYTNLFWKCPLNLFPTIRSGVTLLNRTFQETTLAAPIPTIPSSVTQMRFTFQSSSITAIGTALDAAVNLADMTDTFNGTSLSAAEIDTLLISLDTNNANPAGLTLKYDGIVGGGHLDSNRSGAAATAKSNLISNGATINGTYA